MLTSQLIKPFWLVSAAVALSWCWLLPNHTQPWLSFHSEAWAAAILMAIGIFVIFKSPAGFPLGQFHTLILLLLITATIQHYFGIIKITGTTWINISFLVGIIIAVIVGSKWESLAPGESLYFLTISIVFGSFISVFLQIHQWLGLQDIGPWILRANSGRMSANMAQPNQLGTLLMMGVASCAFLHHQKKLGTYATVLLISFLLFGGALTGSRTFWLNAIVTIFLIYIWRKSKSFSKIFKPALAFGVLFSAFVLFLPILNQYNPSSNGPIELRPVIDQPRIELWKFALLAVSKSPWSGYGIGQGTFAQFSQISPPIFNGSNIIYSHNIFLDLLLWVGIPVGLFISIFFIFWITSNFRNSKSDQSRFTLLVISSLLVHSLLEFPLMYCYYLLPFGILAGSLDVQLDKSRNIRPLRHLPTPIAAIGLILLAVNIFDYFKIEYSFYGLRFEARNIATNIPPTPPDVIAINQWREYISFARLDPAVTHDQETIKKANYLVHTLPSALGMYKLALLHAFNGNKVDAHRWQFFACKFSHAVQCEMFQGRWEVLSQRYPIIDSIGWNELP